MKDIWESGKYVPISKGNMWRLSGLLIFIRTLNLLKTNWKKKAQTNMHL
jgi:hypothetical protein